MTIRTKLTATEAFKLYEFTRDNYVNLKQNDIEFAETAYKAIEPKTHVVLRRIMYLQHVRYLALSLL